MPNLDRLVHSHEGFKRAVGFVSGATIGVWVVAIFFLGAVGMWVYETVKWTAHLGEPRTRFWTHLFAFTDGYGNLTDLGAPMVVAAMCLVLMIVLGIFAKLTRTATLTKMYDRFCNGGFLTVLVPTGVTTRVGSKLTMHVYVLGDADTSMDAVSWAAWRIQTSTVDAHGADYRADMEGALNDNTDEAVEMRQFDPTAPAGLYASLSLVEFTDVVPYVAVPKGPDRSRMTLTIVDTHLRNIV